MAARYQMIARDLERMLLTEQPRKLPTEAALCARYGCSRQTIRSALAILSGKGLITSRRGSGCYPAGAAAGNRRIAVLLPDRSEYISPQILRDIRKVFSEAGFQTDCLDTGSDPLQEQAALEALVQDPPAGILMEPCRDLLPSPGEPLLRQLEHIPFLYLFGHRALPASAVTLATDDAKGAGVLMAQLAAAGHRNIAAIWKADESRGLERFRGSQYAAGEMELHCGQDNILWYTERERQLLLDGQTDLFRRFLQFYRMDCTAVICQNDEIAFRLQRYLAAVHSPMAVASFDNSYLVAGNPGVISLGWGAETPGAAAARILISMLSGKGPAPGSSVVLPWGSIGRSGTADG